MVYTIFLAIVLSLYWWGPYQEKIQKDGLVHNLAINQTNDLRTSGFEEVQVMNIPVEKTITVQNQGKAENSYTIAFMVEAGKRNQNTNQNNYILYQLVLEDGTESEIHNLSLAGGIVTGSLEANQEKQYKVRLWTTKDSPLIGNLSLVANPLV